MSSRNFRRTEFIDMSARVFINYIMDSYNYRYLKDVAKHFNVTPARVSDWLKKDKVPDRHIAKEYSKMNLDETKEIKPSVVPLGTW